MYAAYQDQACNGMNFFIQSMLSAKMIFASSRHAFIYFHKVSGCTTSILSRFAKDFLPYLLLHYKVSFKEISHHLQSDIDLSVEEILFMTPTILKVLNDSRMIVCFDYSNNYSYMNYLEYYFTWNI